MVLQRIQSVYLVIAVILMGVFAFFPGLSNDWVLLTLVSLTSLLAFIDIFLFKNLRRQMMVCLVGIIIGIAMLVTVGIQACRAATFAWSWWFLLPILAIIFLMLARSAMSRDKKLLRDSDRLR